MISKHIDKKYNINKGKRNIASQCKSCRIDVKYVAKNCNYFHFGDQRPLRQINPSAICNTIPIWRNWKYDARGRLGHVLKFCKNICIFIYQWCRWWSLLQKWVFDLAQIFLYYLQPYRWPLQNVWGRRMGSKNLYDISKLSMSFGCWHGNYLQKTKIVANYNICHVLNLK